MGRAVKDDFGGKRDPRVGYLSYVSHMTACVRSASGPGRVGWIVCLGHALGDFETKGC